MRLSAIEQTRRLKTIYTQLCFCYDFPRGSTQAHAVERLQQGLRTLTDTVPWLAGQVVEHEGQFVIVPFHDLPSLSVKDLTHETFVPTMQELRDAGYPFSMLDEKLICRRSSLSDAPGEDGSQPYPVMLLQVNFIHGGILLTILACHSTMDIVGQALMIRLLSQACHGIPLPKEVVMNCNSDRESLIPLLDDNDNEDKTSKSDAVLKAQTTDVTPSPKVPQSIIPKLEWAYFRFIKSALVTLKEELTTTLPESTSFISTDDCICALLWQSLARIRLGRLASGTQLRFSRQVDLRRYMDIPDTYPGNVVSAVASSLSLAELTSSSLGTLASKLRALLVPDDMVHMLRTAATDARNPAKQEHAAGEDGKKRDRENTITMSSWSKVSCHDVDFNLDLGMPVAVRRPKFTPIEGIVYLLPKGPDGEILAGLCLRDEDMEGLRKDSEFCRWTEYVG